LLGFLGPTPGCIQLLQGAIGHFQPFRCNKLLNLTKTSFELILSVSNGAVYAWIKARRVTNIDIAKKLASLAKMDVQALRPTK